MSDIKTHYDNLQVARKATDVVIRAAYKGLAQKHHPDKYEGQPAEADRIMKILNEAIAVLSDPIRRKQHDEWIESQEKIAAQEAAKENQRNAETMRRSSAQAMAEGHRTGNSASPKPRFDDGARFRQDSPSRNYPTPTQKKQPHIWWGGRLAIGVAGFLSIAILMFQFENIRYWVIFKEVYSLFMILSALLLIFNARSALTLCLKMASGVWAIMMAYGYFFIGGGEGLFAFTGVILFMSWLVSSADNRNSTGRDDYMD